MSEPIFETLRHRCSTRIGAALAATGLGVASVVTAPFAGAVSHAAPRHRVGVPATGVVTPDPQALAAQSNNQPLALQLVERLTDASPGSADAEATPLAAQLDAGKSLRSVATATARSQDAVGPTLNTRGYEDLLGRSADSSGMAYFTSQIAAGHTFEWVQRVIATSTEFASHNPTDSAKIAAIFQSMLQRSPDPTGLAYYQGRLAAGWSAGQIVGAIQHSSEYGHREATDAFQTVLWRSADTSGGVYWAGVVNHHGWVAARAGLASSGEFARYGCDPLAGGSCMLPWPNDYYARPDPQTATGLRVNLKASELPANADGVHIAPTQLNRSDGFSPGSTMLVQVPGVDLDTSGVATIDHLDRNGANAPVVVYDTDADEFVPTWTELDVHAPYADPNERLLMVHPMANLADGHHYIVALRNLKNSSGQPLSAPPVFAAYRDGTTTPVAGFAQRKPKMDSMLATLSAKGVQRSQLYLAWDFTVAGTANITGRMLHIRDDAFAQLGSATPSFTVTDNSPGTHSGIARVVEGTFEVPNYLTGTGAPGSVFDEDSAGLPQRNGTFTAVFRCVIPTSALSDPARASLYGHGLFGSVSEVTAGNVQDMAAEHNMVFCGTNWVGMSRDDILTAAGVLQNLSDFPKLADPLQQGVLNFLFLARLMKADPGLGSSAAFQNDSGDSVIAPGNVYYDGNSQGGIEGGVVTAVSTDVTRAVLGVSGMNYPSLLLPRSTDFTQFEDIMKPAYPSGLDRMLALAAMQLEWDRAEPDGYANHMTTDPLPGTPQHQVLMQIALGDHQVSDYAADTEARTIGANAHCPSFDAGRVPDTRLLYGVPCIPSYPYAGSAIVYFDSGSALPGLADTPPAGGHDPHEDPRHDPEARNQKSAFLMPDAQSQVIDVCGGQACHAAQH